MTLRLPYFTIIFALFISISFIPLSSQWLDGGRKQSSDTKGNGGLLVHQGVMYLWNEQNHFQISMDNGKSWNDPKDSIGGANPHVKKITAASGRVYGGLNFGTGNGVPIYSTDKGVTWIADTLGAPGHALGWAGMPVVSDIYAWGHWLYVKWDQPVPHSIKAFDGKYVIDTVMNNGANQPYSVIAKGDTLFAAGSKVYYTTNGGATWIFPKNTGYSGYGGKLLVDGSRLYMFAYRAFLKPCYLYYSDDNAENWTEIDITSLTSRKVLNGDLYSPLAVFIKGNRIEFATNQEKYNSAPNIWKSDDLGKTWSNDTLGLPTTFVSGVVNFAYTSDGMLWCVRNSENIYKQKIDNGSGNSAVESDKIIQATVAPNPSREYFCIQLLDNKSVDNCKIKLYNLSGDEVFPNIEQVENKFNIGWTNQPIGIYLYKVINSNQIAIMTGSIIKK